MRTPAHNFHLGTDRFRQPYAYDFVRPDQRTGLHLHPAGTLRTALVGGRTCHHYGRGQPVHPAFDGLFVAAVDRWLSRPGSSRRAGSRSP